MRIREWILSFLLAVPISLGIIIGVNKLALRGDRHPSWGYWVCSNHHHVIKKVDYEPEMQRLQKEYGCTGWYLEIPGRDK